MYELFNEKLTKYIDERVIAPLEKCYDDSAMYLYTYDLQWLNFTSFVHVLSGIFSYVDKHYMSENFEQKKLSNDAKDKFKTKVFDQ